MKKQDINIVAYGLEPEAPHNQLFMDKKTYNLFLHDAFNWYNNIIADIEKKKWVVDWGKDHNFDVEGLKSIPESYLTTVGSMVKMQTNGFTFSKKHLEYLNNTINNLINQFKNKPKKKVVKRHTIDNVAMVMTDFDNAIDAVFELKEIDVSINYSLTPINIEELKSYYTKQLEFLSDDADYYLHKRLLNKHREILSLLELPVKRVVKTPRIKKPMSKNKQVSKLNYMKKDKSLNIKSINPEKIIGATKLVIFNTNNRKLTIFHSDDGFKMKGSTLLNFNDESGCKTIRKPEMKLSEFLSAPKVRTDKIFEAIKSVKGNVTGRINAHCILLKVF